MDFERCAAYLMKIAISFIFSVLLILVTIFFKWLKKTYAIRKNMREQWKGPPCHWFWGHLDKLLNDKEMDHEKFINWFMEMEKQYPIGFAVYVGPLRASVYMHHPEMIKQVLSAPAHDSSKPPTYQLFFPWIGNGLILSDPPVWGPNRKLLTNAFHFDILKPYAEIMNECSQVMIDKWLDQSRAGGEVNVEMFHDCSLFTLDAVLKCLLSYESNCQREKLDNEYIRAVYNLSKYMTKRRLSLNVLHLFDFFYFKSLEGKDFLANCATVHKMSSYFIAKRRKEHECGVTAVRSMDFLDMLLKSLDEDGNGLSDEMIRSQIDTFLFAGHDTTASAITWCLYCLSENPQHQEKCFDEIKKVLGEEEDVQCSQLSSFPHLTRCIKESFRLFPPIPIIGRQLHKDVSAMGRTVKKGSVTLISLVGAHRNSDIWQNPHIFDPDRFSLEQSSKRHHHSYIPFSAGPRNCIGQNFAMNEVKIAVVKILAKFRVRLDPDHKVIRCMELVLRSKSGVHFLLQQRKDDDCC